MDQFTRRIIGFGLYVGAVDGVALCQVFNQAIARQGLPCYVSSDHDPLFEYHRWRANLRVPGVGEFKTVPYVPWSHPFIERLVGTRRSEYLDHVLFWVEELSDSRVLQFVRGLSSQRSPRSICEPLSVHGLE